MSLSRVLLLRGAAVAAERALVGQGLVQSGRMNPAFLSHSFATCSRLLNPEQVQQSSHEARNTSLNNETRNKIVPNANTKKMLVWSGQYKHEDEIPEYITAGQMSKARGWFRMRLATFLMIFTLVGCVIVARQSKDDMRAGLNVSKQNHDWHISMGSKGKDKID